jgi:Putative prokaryotic signal transducing protein
MGRGSTQSALEGLVNHARTTITQVADTVRLTVVANQAEADIVCSLLRAHGIACADRPANMSADVIGVGGGTEILVTEDDLESARELLEESPPE